MNCPITKILRHNFTVQLKKGSFQLTLQWLENFPFPLSELFAHFSFFVPKNLLSNSKIRNFFIFYKLLFRNSIFFSEIFGTNLNNNPKCSEIFYFQLFRLHLTNHLCHGSHWAIYTPASWFKQYHCYQTKHGWC